MPTWPHDLVELTLSLIESNWVSGIDPMKTPACRISCGSMGGENSPNDFDLDLVTFTYNIWPWSLWHLTLTYDLWHWPLWPWPWTIFSDTRLKTGIFTFFYFGDLDLWPMTFTLVQDMLDINVCANFQVHIPIGLASRAQTDRRTHTHRHTHGTKNITSSANAGGKKLGEHFRDFDHAHLYFIFAFFFCL